MGHMSTATQEAITLRRKAAAAKAWETMRAKKATQLEGIREGMQQTAESLNVDDLSIVQLYLLSGGDGKLDPDYQLYRAPSTPVTGLSHYVVIGRAGKAVTLLHPPTLTKFDIPVFSFRPRPADPTCSRSRIAKQIASRITLHRQLKREVPKCAEQVCAAFAQKAVN
jgi:hypothetical protein